jgi:hypothetical protein
MLGTSSVNAQTLITPPSDELAESSEELSSVAAVSSDEVSSEDVSSVAAVSSDVEVSEDVSVEVELPHPEATPAIIIALSAIARARLNFLIVKSSLKYLDYNRLLIKYAHFG